MLKIYIVIGFSLFFTGMLLAILWSKNLGITICLFGFLLASLSIGFMLWLKNEGAYNIYHRIFSVIWIVAIIYNTSDMLVSPYLISEGVIYIAYLITSITFLYLLIFNKQNTEIK